MKKMAEATVNNVDKKICEICKFSATNEYDYGPWKTSEDCTVHYFCVLLSSDAVQNGQDDEGIDGFLVKDIRTMCKSYTKTRCVYCWKPRATVRCCATGCLRRFHVVCGTKNKCLSEFIDPFRSYCDKHAQIVENPYKHAPDSICQICFDALGEYNAFTSIPACCEYDGSIDYYHKACIQTHAVKFGLEAKCPSCRNREDADGYRKFLSLRGIFCPVKDADYELSKDAYQSLLYKHKTCDMAECQCPKGRNHIRSKGDWKYYLCEYCGGFGTHEKCRDDGSTGLGFACRDCIAKQSQGTQAGLLSHITRGVVDEVNDSTTHGDADEVNDLNANVQKRKHKFDAEAEGKEWKIHRTDDDPFKSATYNLVNSGDEPAVDPIKQKHDMRKDRLAMFFDNADFSSKPKPPAWLI